MTEHTIISESRPGSVRYGLLLGTSIVAAVICVMLALQWPTSFWYGYLVAANFWISTSMGCVGIALVHGTSGGRWGRAIGRSLHAGIGTLLVALLACWILAAGAQLVFPWAGPESRWNLLNPHEKRWLEPWAVGIRFAVTSVLWMIMAVWLNRCYRREASDRNYVISARLTSIGLMVLFVTFSIVAVDFMMALTPHWVSTMFPLIRVLNCAVCGMSLVVISHTMQLTAPTREEIERTHDVGNLLQAFNLLWVYLAFSQYLLIWSGDMVEEVEWYLERRTPLWSAAALFLFIFHFAVPFLLLLSRPLKRNPARLQGVAWLLLVVCLVDICWTILPSCAAPMGPALGSTAASLVAIGGIWLAAFGWHFVRLPVLPINDEQVDHAVEAAGATP